METALFAYLLDNGPMSALAAGFFWLWRREANARKEADEKYTSELCRQIDLWKNLKEQADAQR